MLSHRKKKEKGGGKAATETSLRGLTDYSLVFMASAF